MQNFSNLIVGQKAYQLTLKVYTITKSYPSHEQFGLTSQLRRAGSSIPTNLAEGCGKLTDLDFRRYVNIAFGSSNELAYRLLLSVDLKYISVEDYTKLDEDCKEIKKMLSSLIGKLGKRIFTSFLFLSILIIGIIHLISL
jgi:four helix bundle protein